MTVGFIVKTLLPTLVPIAAGYAAARWAGLRIAGLQTALRFVLLPALLFILLIGPIKQPVLLKVALAGGVTAVAGFFLLPLLSKALKTNIDVSAAFPNVACLSLPFLLLSWEHRPLGLRTAAVFFVAAAIAYMFAESRSDGFKKLLREPWLWAAIAALVVQLADVDLKDYLKAVRPIGSAGYPVLLLLVGASLPPIGKATFTDTAAWLSVGFRFVVGFAVAVLALLAFKLPRVVDETLVVVAFAPPATAALSLARIPAKEGGSAQVAALGTFASLAAMIVLLAVDW